MSQRLITGLEPLIPRVLKRSITRCRLWARAPTSQIRLMPDFIIIGAQRGGTTSLYSYAIEHPHIAPAIKKEVHFFSRYFEKGAGWYRAHFPSLTYVHYVRRVHKHGLITGEASPYYIFHPLVPQRIARVLPRVKLIAVLRNPVDRAYSHYWHEVRMGYETLSFEEAIRVEPQRLRGEGQRLLEDERYYSVAHRHYSYLARGIYVDQLRAWRRFFSEEQFLILRSEDLYADPAARLEQVYEFLDVPNHELSEYKRHNLASYPQMNPDVRRQLSEYFRPHNERLCEYLGTCFNWE